MNCNTYWINITITVYQLPSCTRMVTVLHAVSAMHPAPFPLTSSTTDDADEEPVTSLACTSKEPRKQKASNHATKCYRSGLGNLAKVN